MKAEEIIKRYIYAVTRHIKPSDRNDIGEELRTIIDDMITEQFGANEPSEADIYKILEELGTPAELAQKYDANGKECLIGPPYYSMYKMLLKLVGACVIFGVSLGELLEGITGGFPWYEIILNMISGLIGGAFVGFGVITIIFAFLYQKGIKMDNLYDELRHLPPVPENHREIKRSDVIYGIVITVIFFILFLFFPEIICAPDAKTHTLRAVLNTDFIRGTWYFMVIFAFLGLFRDITKLIEGRYTGRLLLVTIVSNFATILVTFLWMNMGNLLNQEFIADFLSTVKGDSGFLTLFFERFHLIFLACLTFSLLLDCLVTAVRTIRK